MISSSARQDARAQRNAMPPAEAIAEGSLRAGLDTPLRGYSTSMGMDVDVGASSDGCPRFMLIE